jgi:hypothetical protein
MTTGGRFREPERAGEFAIVSFFDRPVALHYRPDQLMPIFSGLHLMPPYDSWYRVYACLLALALGSACNRSAPDLAAVGFSCPAEASPFALTLVDSVVLQENDSALLGNPSITFAANPRGTLFIPDLEQNRVSVYSGSGVLQGHLGRSGGGPGEFVTLGSFGLATDSLIIQADGGGSRLNLFDPQSRRYLGQISYQGYLSWIAPAPGMFLVGLLGSQAVAFITPPIIREALEGAQTAPLLSSLVSLPKEYSEYPMLNSWRDVKVAPYGDKLLVIFGGTDYLQVVSAGAASDTVRIPICGRRGAPKERLDQFFAQRLVGPPGETADTISAVLGLYRLPSAGYLVWFQDPVFKDGGRVFEGAAFLSLVSPSLRRVCVDARVEAPGTGRARLAVSGDSVFVLDQVATNASMGASYTVVRKYLIDSTSCRWIQTGAVGEH